MNHLATRRAAFISPHCGQRRVDFLTTNQPKTMTNKTTTDYKVIVWHRPPGHQAREVARFTSKSYAAIFLRGLRQVNEAADLNFHATEVRQLVSRGIHES